MTAPGAIYDAIWHYSRAVKLKRRYRSGKFLSFGILATDLQIGKATLIHSRGDQQVEGSHLSDRTLHERASGSDYAGWLADQFGP